MTAQRKLPSRRLKLTVGVALLCSCAVALAACGSSSPASNGAGSASGGGTASGSVRGKTVALISCTDANPWCNGFNTTMQKGLAAKGVKLTTLTSNFSAAQSEQQFSQALTRKPDLILFYINDENAAIPSLLAAKRAHVPVIAVDTALNGEAAKLVDAQLLPDHTLLGRFAAMSIQEGLEKQGIKKGNVIMITGTQSQYEVTERINGFKQQLAKTPQYKIVSIQDGNWDPIQSGTIAQQLFAKYGSHGIQAAYGMADYMAAAISQAAKQAGIPLYPESHKGMVVVGSNCAPTGVRAIETGLMYAGATQAPTSEATADVPHVIDALQGHKPGVVNVPQVRLTKANIAQYAKVCNY